MAQDFIMDEKVRMLRHTGYSMLIRRSKREEVEILKSFVQMVVDEVYGYPWVLPSPVDTREAIASRIQKENWSQAWVAVERDMLIGTVLTQDEWIGDLWVLNSFRGQGVGSQLLLRGEAEIISRGYETLRLRVVKANQNALAFYKRQGWHTAREFPHETLPFIDMMELNKTIASISLKPLPAPE